MTRRRGWKEALREDDGFLSIEWSVAQSPWTLEGRIRTFGLVSRTIAGRPPATHLTGDSFTIIERFTCPPSGSTTIYYEGTVLAQLMVRSYYREPRGGVTEVLAEQRRYSLFGITSINCVVSATESLTETTTEPADGEAVAVGGGGGEEVPDDSESGDSAGDADSPPAPPTPATAGPAGTNPGECAGYVAPVAGPESTCYGAPTVSMSQPEIGLASTVYITAAPNTEFLKITCHQPVGEEEVCSAFVRETDANGHFAGETEMLMGPGSWTEIVCLPVDKCTEEFPSLADLRAFLAFGDGCRNGVCAASTSATAE